MQELYEMLKKGDTNKQILDQNPGLYIRFHNGINEARKLMMTHRVNKTRVVVLYGPTNVGKSHWVRVQAPDAFWKQSRTTWWDGYEG